MATHYCLWGGRRTHNSHHERERSRANHQPPAAWRERRRTPPHRETLALVASNYSPSENHNYSMGNLACIPLPCIPSPEELKTPEERAQMEQEAQEAEILASFRKFDVDGSGSISVDELRITLREVLGEETPDEDLEEMVKAADINGDGDIDYSEFVEMMSSA